MSPLDLTQKPPRSPKQELCALCMLPRMIDIARAMLPDGKIGDYQIGVGMSGFIFAKLGVTTSEFVRIVEKALGDDDVSERLELHDKKALCVEISARLRKVTVADVSAEMRAVFDKYYDSDLPANQKVLDVLEADDAKVFMEKRSIVALQ